MAHWDAGKVYALLSDYHSHTTYTPESVTRRLTECGFEARPLPDGSGIRIGDTVIGVSQPDWGGPGIWSLSLAYALYKIMTGQSYVSEYVGRGFQYRDLLERFRELAEEQSGADNPAAGE
ncbi:MAG: hypothetical protein ACE149_06935 [Armatimonadota bacterium]